jgi:hypothetical protein
MGMALRAMGCSLMGVSEVHIPSGYVAKINIP